MSSCVRSLKCVLVRCNVINNYRGLFVIVMMFTIPVLWSRTSGGLDRNQAFFRLALTFLVIWVLVKIALEAPGLAW